MKACTALDVSLMANIVLGFVFCYTYVLATQLSPRAVYFIQTGGSTSSNTFYSIQLSIKNSNDCAHTYTICITCNL